MGRTAPDRTTARQVVLQALRICQALALVGCLAVGHALAPTLLAGDPPTCPAGETRMDAGCVRLPEPVHRIWPSYPPEARAKRVEGLVKIGGTINTKGEIEEPTVLTSSATDDSFLRAFEEAALAAVKKTRYRPAKVNGELVDMYFTKTVEFKAH